MILDGELGVMLIDSVKPHVGHDIEVVRYLDRSYSDGEGDPTVEYSVECLTCGEVIVTAPVQLM